MHFFRHLFNHLHALMRRLSDPTHLPIVTEASTKQAKPRTMRQAETVSILLQLTTMTITTYTPICSCGCPGTRRDASPDNPNGNANRPYYRCEPCGRFLTFCDGRGLGPANPECWCGQASRRQVTRHDHAVSRAIHFVCQSGRCSYYEARIDQDGRWVRVPPGMMGTLINASYV